MPEIVLLDVPSMIMNTSGTLSIGTRNTSAA